MPAQSFVEALHEQIGNEFGAEQQYIACAVYYESQTLPQLANLFYKQALEERNHAMMMLAFLLDRGGEVKVPGVAAPVTAWEADRKRTWVWSGVEDNYPRALIEPVEAGVSAGGGMAAQIEDLLLEAVLLSVRPIDTAQFAEADVSWRVVTQKTRTAGEQYVVVERRSGAEDSATGPIRRYWLNPARGMAIDEFCVNVGT